MNKKENYNPLNILQNRIYAVFWFWIAFVSSFDTYLTVRFRDEMFHGEQNPIAREIMRMDNWDVSLFIGIKMFFTIFVLGTLIALYSKDRKCAFATIFALVAFQTILLIYLLYDHHWIIYLS